MSALFYWYSKINLELIKINDKKHNGREMKSVLNK